MIFLINKTSHFPNEETGLHNYFKEKFLYHRNYKVFHVMGIPIKGGFFK